MWVGLVLVCWIWWFGFILFALGVVMLSGLVFWLWRFACLGSWFVLGCVGWVFWLGFFLGGLLLLFWWVWCLL